MCNHFVFLAPFLWLRGTWFLGFQLKSSIHVCIVLIQGIIGYVPPKTLQHNMNSSWFYLSVLTLIFMFQCTGHLLHPAHLVRRLRRFCWHNLQPLQWCVVRHTNCLFFWDFVFILSSLLPCIKVCCPPATIYIRMYLFTIYTKCRHDQPVLHKCAAHKYGTWLVWEMY